MGVMQVKFGSMVFPTSQAGKNIHPGFSPQFAISLTHLLLIEIQFASRNDHISVASATFVLIRCVGSACEPTAEDKVHVAGAQILDIEITKEV
jgi:hypothetical protein